MLALLAVAALSIGFGIFQSQAAQRLEREQKLTREALDKAEARQLELEAIDKKRRQFERLSAALALDQGLNLCMQGEVNRGLL